MQDKLSRAAALHHKLSKFYILVDNIHTLADVSAYPVAKPWSIWIKLDCGNHRAGLQPADIAGVELAKAISSKPNCELAGAYVHAGQSYACRGVAQIRTVAEDERKAVTGFKKL